MKIDRIADFDDEDPNLIEVKHFIDTGFDINFGMMVECSYPPREFDDIIVNRYMIDEKKLRPNKARTNLLTYDEREKFEEDRAGWMNEGGNTYGWADIEPDNIFLYGINSVSKEMIKDIFE